MKTKKAPTAPVNAVVRLPELSNRDKAAVIVGMVRAFQCGGWPKHFKADDRATWRQRGKFAIQMLGDGVFNPLDAYSVLELFDDEFSEI